MRINGAVERVTQQGAKIVRETVGINTLALDQPGIAEGSFLGGSAAVDEHHLARPFLQVQRYADADHSRTEHDGIGTHHRIITGHRKQSRSTPSPFSACSSKTIILAPPLLASKSAPCPQPTEQPQPK